MKKRKRKNPPREVPMQSKVQLGGDWYAVSRGCTYEPEWYDIYKDIQGNIERQGVVIYCFNKKGERVWSASTNAYPDDRVLDVVRQAKDNWKDLDWK